MSRVVKFYVRTAFIYNYSILFDDSKEYRSKSRSKLMRSVSSSNRTTRTNSVTSFDAKRERILKYAYVRFEKNNCKFFGLK